MNGPDPHTRKEFPPEISGADEFPLPLHFDNEGKDLVPPQRSLDLCLSISDHVVAVLLLPIDPMHHILTGIPLVEHHIPSPQFAVRFCKIDIIPVMAEERRHAAPRDQHGYDFPLLRDLPEYRYIFSCIDCLSPIMWRLLYCPLRTPDQKSIAIRLDSSSLSSVTFVSITRYTLWHRFSTLGL